MIVFDFKLLVSISPLPGQGTIVQPRVKSITYPIDTYKDLNAEAGCMCLSLFPEDCCCCKSNAHKSMRRCWRRFFRCLGRNQGLGSLIMALCAILVMAFSFKCDTINPVPSAGTDHAARQVVKYGLITTEAPSERLMALQVSREQPIKCLKCHCLGHASVSSAI